MICVAAVLMIGVCYPVLMIYDYVIDARLHEIGIPQTFAYRTKSMEIEDEADAIPLPAGRIRQRVDFHLGE